MIFSDVVSEDGVLIGHPNHGIARPMGAARMKDVHPSAAQPGCHPVGECHRGAGQTGNFLVPNKEPRKTAEFASPILLAAFFDHGRGGIRHDDLRRAIDGCAQYPHSVIMGRDKVADQLALTAQMQSITFRARRGVACALITITLSSPMMIPVLRSPSAVKV